MKVDVKLYATLRSYGPAGLEVGESFPLALDEGSVEEALMKLSIPPEKAKIIMVNGIRVEDNSQLMEDGDLLVVFPPIGGG